MENSSNDKINKEVAAVFYAYPHKIKTKLLMLRQLIYETMVRIAWKASKKDQYSMFFKCTAILVPAFKEKFSKIFRYGRTVTAFYWLFSFIKKLRKH